MIWFPQGMHPSQPPPSLCAACPLDVVQGPPRLLTFHAFFLLHSFLCLILFSLFLFLQLSLPTTTRHGQRDGRPGAGAGDPAVAGRLPPRFAVHGGAAGATNVGAGHRCAARRAKPHRHGPPWWEFGRRRSCRRALRPTATLLPVLPTSGTAAVARRDQRRPPRPRRRRSGPRRGRAPQWRQLRRPAGGGAPLGPTPWPPPDSVFFRYNSVFFRYNCYIVLLLLVQKLCCDVSDEVGFATIA